MSPQFRSCSLANLLPPWSSLQVGAPYCEGLLSCGCCKKPWKQLGGEQLHFDSIIHDGEGEEVTIAGFEAACYIAVTIRKREFLHFMQSATPACGVVLPTFIGVGLSSSVNLTETIPHRHTQRPVSWVIPDSTRLTILTIPPTFHLQSSTRVRNISSELSA